MTSQAFKDVVVAVSGTFTGGYNHAKIQSAIKKLGGAFRPGVTDDLTHFITTPKEADSQSKKYKQAAKVYSCEIVSIDWLVDSQEAGKPLPEKPYSLGLKQKDTQADSGDDQDKKNMKEESPKKKRTLEEALNINEDEGATSKKAKDGQKAGTKSLNVPVDEYCPHKATRSVHIDDSGLIWDATLNQTVAAANNNKFYRIQILVDWTGGNFLTWTRWGRVGEVGQSALLGGGSFESAKMNFEKKFKDKSGLKWEDRLSPPKKGKYTFIERNYEEDSDTDEDEDGKGKQVKKEDRAPVESTLPASVQELMKFIFNRDHFMSVMTSLSYDAMKLPLGKLSKRTLRTGFQLLKDLSELLANPALAQSKYDCNYVEATEYLSNQYFTTIPHVFGRNRPPVLNSTPQIQKEIELLEALTDMELANEIMDESKKADEINELDRQFQGLGMKEMTPLNPKSNEFRELHNYLLNSVGSTHHMDYKIMNIFRLERQGEDARFKSSRFANIQNSNRRLLWHGSRSTNFGGILSQGLRIAPPEAPVSGYMYGKGVYFADMSSKSANYCRSYSSANTGLLLLCDVELGNPMLELNGPNYDAGNEAKKEGKIATLGRGGVVPAGWKNAGCVNQDLDGVTMPDVAASTKQLPNHGLCYNEYIVYDVAQIRQKYLFQVRMN